MMFLFAATARGKQQSKVVKEMNLLGKCSGMNE